MADPELYAAFRLADRRGMTVAASNRTVSRNEFVQWMAYGEIEIKRHDKLDYYLAQIAQLIDLQNQKPGTRTSIKQYLISFGEKAQKVVKLQPKQLRNVICGWFGIDPNKPKEVNKKKGKR